MSSKYHIINEDPKEKYEEFKDVTESRRIKYKGWGFALIFINLLVTFLNAMFAEKAHIMYCTAIISFIAAVVAAFFQFGKIHNKYINSLSTFNKLKSLFRGFDTLDEVKDMSAKDKDILFKKKFNQILDEYEDNELNSEIGSSKELDKYLTKNSGSDSKG